MRLQFFRIILNSILSISLAVPSQVAWSQPPTRLTPQGHHSTLVMESPLKAPDGSLLQIQMPLTSENVDERRELVQRRLFPEGVESDISLRVFVPASLSEEELKTYLEFVEFELRQMVRMGESHQFKIDVEPIRIDVKGTEIEALRARKAKAEVTEQLIKEKGAPEEMRQVLHWTQREDAKIIFALLRWKDRIVGAAKSLVKFKRDFGEFSNWTARRRHRAAGTIFGLVRSAGGITFWVGNAQKTVFKGLLAGFSLFLDVIFSRYPDKIEAIKANHRIPFLKKTWVVRLYNENFIVKAFVVNNLIGASTNLIFRFLSFLDNPRKVTAPWTAEALLSLFGALSVGGVAGTLGGQAAYTARRKGRISPGTEYFLYQMYGLIMQLEGLAYGAGATPLFLAMFATESTFKVGFYGFSRLLSPKERPWLLIHHGFMDEFKLSPEELARMKGRQMDYRLENRVYANTLESILYEHGRHDRLSARDVEELDQKLEDLYQDSPFIRFIKRVKDGVKNTMISVATAPVRGAKACWRLIRPSSRDKGE